MKIFIDSADIKEIQQASDLGICDGVTTNPTLIAKSGRDMKKVLFEIVNAIPGHVSAEVISSDYKEMLKEAEELTKISNNIVVKLPPTPDGLKVCRHLASKGVKINVTLCFTVAQALLSAKMGATYVSPFIGRLDDIGEKGISLIQDIRSVYAMHGIATKILAASIRSPRHVVDSIVAGADAVTAPWNILLQLYSHPLTEQGLAEFMRDWQHSGQVGILS